MESRTICRRLELHDLSSPILFHVIQRAVQAAQQKTLLSSDILSPHIIVSRSEELPRNADLLPYRRDKRFDHSWNIRVAIDDLSTLKDTYPDIGSDPIFLPFLLSFLELEGVTSLIIDSHMGRPDAIVSDAFDRELRALVPHKLLTWRVPFFGGIRDAITVVPPYPTGLPSLIREVRWESREGAPNALIVDPELELYSGLERGDPSPIPLEVKLYSETSAVAEYIREENEILCQLFTPLASGSIIVGVEAGQYEGLRDFCNLQTDALLNHTMVFQVDECWATSRDPGRRTASQFPRGPISRREGVLYPLGQYLAEPTSVSTGSKEFAVDRVADPFGVFQGEPSAHGAPKSGPWTRRHYFARSSNGLSMEPQPSHLANVDRIPYTWDFGFLLCPSSMWESAGARLIGYGNKTVREIWHQLPNAMSKEAKSYVSWRAFLGACKCVAQAQAERTAQPVRALDISTNAGESFCSLVLEIWASEIADLLDSEGQKTFLNSVDHIDWVSPGSESLIGWLANEEYRLAFYKTWLLLVDALTLSDLVDRQKNTLLRTRQPDGSAVATRHWYKTACGHQYCQVTNEITLPVRLPGHFSVRGDWFLAVAGGSRSERLARRALDFFSTQRANFRRMELGIGLPTRDISPSNMFDRLPTGLVTRDQRGRTIAVTYGDLLGTGIEKRPDFKWFWRSQLRDYHRHTRPWQRWMWQMIVKWDDLRTELGSEWRSCFAIYDELKGKRFTDAKTLLNGLDSWNEFEQMCSVLQEQLSIASRSSAYSGMKREPKPHSIREGQQAAAQTA